jgi:hypothetical protein
LWYSGGMATDAQLPSPPSRNQTPEDIIHAISLEIEHSNKASAQLGREKLVNASALAVDTLIQVMLYSDNEATRRAAANDVLAYVYGSNAQRAPLADATEAAYKVIFDEITQDA